MALVNVVQAGRQAGRQALAARTFERRVKDLPPILGHRYARHSSSHVDTRASNDLGSEAQAHIATKTVVRKVPRVLQYVGAQLEDGLVVEDELVRMLDRGIESNLHIATLNQYARVDGVVAVAAMYRGPLVARCVRLARYLDEDPSILGS